jgi:hypothetical protein
MLEAIRVGGGAGAAIATAVTHAETEMVITTEVDDAHAHDLAPLTAITAPVTTGITVTAETATEETAIMDAVVMTSVAKLSVKKATPSLPKMKEIVALFLCSNLPLVCALASSRSSSRRLDLSMKLKLSRTVSAKDPRGKPSQTKPI